MNRKPQRFEGGPIEAVELNNPAYTCPYCHFTTWLAGSWAWVNGRLTFTADEDEQPRRGPDRWGCSEGERCGDFSGDIETQDGLLTGGPEPGSVLEGKTEEEG